jgi:protein-tyrosine phosphatase
MNGNHSPAAGKAAAGGLPGRVPLEGTYNLRDIAAYRNRRGQPLRRGVYYRADNLARLTPAGEAAFRSLGVRTVIDLRTEQEIRVFPNRLAEGSGLRYHSVDLVGNSHEIISRGDTIVSVDIEERLESGYFADPAGRLIAIYTTMLDHQGEAFRRTFSLLASKEATPAVFHCVAGQDRTGLVAAFLLSVAEVPEEVIVFDYAATAHYNVHRYIEENAQAYWGMPIGAAEEYGSQFCPPEAMRGTLDHLRERYGGALGYLREVGVTEAELVAVGERLLG